MRLSKMYELLKMSISLFLNEYSMLNTIQRKTLKDLKHDLLQKILIKNIILIIKKRLYQRSKPIFYILF